MDDLLRLLDVITERLGAEDARLELGGRPPAGDDILWTTVGDGWRVVVRFAEAVDDAALEAKLDALLAAFEGVASRVGDYAPAFAATPRADDLAYALDVLRDNVGAAAAAVIDDASPVLWGVSRPRPVFADVYAALALAELADALDAAGAPPIPTLAGDLPAPSGLSATHADHLARLREGTAPGARWAADLATARAIACIRDGALAEPGHHRGDGFGLVARPFGGAYTVLLAFVGPFSEVSAEGTLLRARPAIDRLVELLPPIEPGPRGPTPGGDTGKATVLRLPHP